MMRRRVLIESVRRLLPDDVAVVDAIYMWRRSSNVLLWVAAVAASVVAVLSVLGYGSVTTRLMLALAGAIVVSVLTTDYRVLAHTANGAHLFAASRVRQAAVRPIGLLSADAVIEVVSSNMVLSEWNVDGLRYAVPRGSQDAMTALADAR